MTNGMKKPASKKKMVCECGAFVLVRTEWKHKQSKKHIQFILRKLVLEQRKYEAVYPVEQQQRYYESPDQQENPLEQSNSDPEIDNKQEVQQLRKQPISESRNIVGVLYKKTPGVTYDQGQQKQMMCLTPMYASSQRLGLTPFSVNICHPSSGQHTNKRHAPQQQPVFYFAHSPQQQQWQQMPAVGFPRY